MDRATSDAYFARSWAGSDDPWDHAGRWYEARKYALTVAALPRERYRRSFEPGCGAGVLTERLAARSDEHLAMERHPRGVAATRRRCAALPSVRAVEGRIPDDWPEGPFDLIVLSELLYYLSDGQLDDVLARCDASLEPGGDVVAVHYRGEVAEHVRSGDDVHHRLARHPGWELRTGLREPDFVLTVLRAPGPEDER